MKIHLVRGFQELESRLEEKEDFEEGHEPKTGAANRKHISTTDPDSSVTSQGAGKPKLQYKDVPDPTQPARVVVLDATWHLARRLYARTPALRAMPQLSLSAPNRSRKRLRDQHRADGMSTLEAVAAAVARIEGAGAAEPLERLYDEVVRRTTGLRWGFAAS